MKRVFTLEEVLTVTTGFNFSSRNSAIAVIESCLPAEISGGSIQLQPVQEALCKAFPAIKELTQTIVEELDEYENPFHSRNEKNQYLLEKVEAYAHKTGIDLSFAEFRITPETVKVSLPPRKCCTSDGNEVSYFTRTR